jgi:hypothetical protein
MSTPGHHNEVVLVGDVGEVFTDGNGAAIGVILMVDTDAPCEVPIMFPAARPGVSVGNRLWVRGRLAFEPMPHRHGLLHVVQARHVDPVRRTREPRGQATPPLGLAACCRHDLRGMERRLW